MLTIKAKDLLVGDATDSGSICAIRQVAKSVVIEITGQPGEARIPAEWMVSIARAVADCCPRGNLMIDDYGLVTIDKKSLLCAPLADRRLVAERIVALWNEAEAEKPYRPIAKISRGEAL